MLEILHRTDFLAVLQLLRKPLVRICSYQEEMSTGNTILRFMQNLAKEINKFKDILRFTEEDYQIS